MTESRGIAELIAAGLLAVVVLVTAGCDGPAPPETRESANGGEPVDYEGTWKLVGGHGPKGDIPIVDRYRITMIVDGRSINGVAACNHYYGEIKGEDIELLSKNEMGCRPDVERSETAYMDALSSADDIAREDDRLILTGKETDLVFELVSPIRIGALVDTRWELVSLILPNGKRVRPEPAAAPATLLLGSNGRFTATTGCSREFGKWVEDGDEIAFPVASSRGFCPEALRDQQGHVGNVLGDGFAPTIEGNRLTLLDRGGLGLEYRAAE